MKVSINKKAILCWLSILAILIFQAEILFSQGLYQEKKKPKNLSEIQPAGFDLFKSNASVSSNISVTGRWIFGDCDAFYSVNDLLFYSNGGHLNIADVSEPSAPSVLSQYAFSDNIEAVAVTGNYAYVAGGEFVILDITDTSNPVLAGSCDPEVTPTNVFISGDYAYMAAGNDGIIVISISDPANPQVVGSYSSGERIHEVIVQNNRAYFADSNGLTVLDISNPSTPVKSGECLYVQSQEDINNIGPSSVAVAGNYAYYQYFGVRVVDITDPDNPVQIAVVRDDIEDFFIANNKMYLNSGHKFISVNIDNPFSPLIETEYNKPVYEGGGGEIFIEDNLAYITENSGLKIFDISNPSDIDELYLIEHENEVKGVYVSGNYAYLASAYNGLVILDISDVSNPVKLGALENSGTDYSFGIEVSGDYAYLFNTNTYMKIINISDPENPFLAGTYDAGNDYTRKGIVSGDYIFTQDYGSTYFRIFNVSDPSNIVEINSYATGVSWTFCRNGDYAYIGGHEEGIIILNVSNVNNITHVRTVDTPGSARGMYIKGSYGYLADFAEGLRIYDITDPENPVELGSCKTNDNAYNVVVNEDYAFVSDFQSGVCVIDVSDPGNPVKIDSISTGYRTREIFLSNDFVFAAAEGNGLIIIENKIVKTTEVDQDFIDLKGFSLHGNYPNPFNPETWIRFEIPAVSDVKVKIYNIKGQLIRSLVTKNFPAGSHSLKWNGKNDRGQKVGSGVYIYRVQAGKFTRTKKMTLIK